jgi:hypothetical protein
MGMVGNVSPNSFKAAVPIFKSWRRWGLYSRYTLSFWRWRVLVGRQSSEEHWWRARRSKMCSCAKPGFRKNPFHISSFSFQLHCTCLDDKVFPSILVRKKKFFQFSLLKWHIFFKYMILPCIFNRTIDSNMYF